MRILFVSDYAPWGKVARGKMPSQHLFGIHELVERYEFVGNEVRGILNGGYVDLYKITTSSLPHKLHEFYKAFKVARRSRNYDVVYISIGHCAPFSGLMRQIGIMKAKLVVVAHHPPFKMLKST